MDRSTSQFELFQNLRIVKIKFIVIAQEELMSIVVRAVGWVIDPAITGREMHKLGAEHPAYKLKAVVSLSECVRCCRPSVALCSASQGRGELLRNS